MTEGLGVRKRYGYQILKLHNGTWFWAPPLQTVDFVPKGRQNSEFGEVLRDKDNTLAGATKVVLQIELNRYKGGTGVICVGCRNGFHEGCRDGTWCDCQHRVPEPEPELPPAILDAIDRAFNDPEFGVRRERPKRHEPDV